MEKVLVTGAGGFIGHAVVERLAKMDKYEVTAVISGRHPVMFPNDVLVETANLLDGTAREALMSRICPDIMLHFAWGMENNQFLLSEVNMQWVEASLHLSRLFCQYKGRRFVFAGTGYEYGSGFPTNAEQIEKMPTYSLYGSCKLSLEHILTIFFKQNAIEFAIPRYFAVYGPGDRRPGCALPESIKSLLQGKPFSCKSPNNIWDYVYIDDAADATVKLLCNEYCGPMNIASGNPVTMRYVFSEVADAIGQPELVTFEGNTVCGTILVADISLMASVLNYRCATPFRVGLEKTVQWWRERLNIPEENKV